MSPPRHKQLPHKQPPSPQIHHPRRHNHRPKHLCRPRALLPTRPREKLRPESRPQLRPRITRPSSPVITWARSLSLPVKTTQEPFSTENFNGNLLEPANCASQISNSRTTLYKSPKAASRIPPSKRSAFARERRPDLSSTSNRNRNRNPSLAWPR